MGTKSLFRAFSCVQHIGPPRWTTSITKDIFCITKLSTLFPHLPLFHIIGASAQSLEELIQTFRSMPSLGKNRSSLTIWEQNADENIFFSLRERFWGEARFVSKEQFSSFGFCILPPNCENVIKLRAPQTPRAPLLSELYFD